MRLVCELTKKCYDCKVVADHNLLVERGEVVSITGPCGAVKSSRLRNLNLLAKPARGQMIIGGQFAGFRQLTRHCISSVRRQSARVFQRSHVLHNQTALDNIADVLACSRGYLRKDAHEPAKVWLSAVGLSYKAREYPVILSGGHQQRVGIARALSPEPKVLLPAEPASALDPELTRNVLRLIVDLAGRGCTMPIVTHEIRFASQMFHRLLMMDKGGVIAQGTPHALMAAPEALRLRQLLSCATQHTGGQRL